MKEGWRSSESLAQEKYLVRRAAGGNCLRGYLAFHAGSRKGRPSKQADSRQARQEGNKQAGEEAIFKNPNTVGASDEHCCGCGNGTSALFSALRLA
jgi:hypothetical protein